DGWLFKGENFQVMNTIVNEFKGKVQTIYIDPPFNKNEESGYHYSVNYDDNVWLSMLDERLKIAREFLSHRGNFFARCDYRGTLFMRYLMDSTFGKDNFRNEIAVGRTKGKKKTTKSLPTIKDALFLYGNSNDNFLKEVLIPTPESETKEKLGRYFSRKKRLPKELNGKEISKKIRETLWVPLSHRPEVRRSTMNRTLFGRTFTPPPNRHWIKTQEKINSLAERGKARIRCKCGYIHGRDMGEWKGCPACGGDAQRIEVFLDEEPLTDSWVDISGYAQTWGFPTENTEQLLQRVIESSSNEGDIIMDFFSGSGTTIAVAHKLGRRWIGIEMGHHFHSVILPRMKKVLAGHLSGISKERNVKSGGFFKYSEIKPLSLYLRKLKLDDLPINL
ncbi:MAG: DNA methyltransferase, partial [Promethearchaeota archaeon]